MKHGIVTRFDPKAVNGFSLSESEPERGFGLWIQVNLNS
jgi:hypothetical protein